MYTLRKITGDGYEMNFCLGKSYGIEYRERNEEEFKNRFKEYIEAHGDDIYGMVCDEQSKFHCLFKKQKNYIMTSDGNTFSNITFK